MGIKITVGGDFCVTTPYTTSNLFSQEVIGLFDQSDLNIVNLECPVIEDDNKDKIIKTGPHLCTGKQIFDVFKQINIHAVTLANNHILDFGARGLETTIRGCHNNNIITAGAGNNLKEAAKPVIIEKRGLKIALINFCEHEFSIATEQTPGANPLDLIDNSEEIKKAHQIADFVLVIVHGGHEHYPLPSPRMVKQYRYFADCGADAIICHHAHCISGVEVYNNVPIFYGIGNLLFTMPCKYKGWNNGLLVQMDFNKGDQLKWRIIPTQQSVDNYLLSFCSDKDRVRMEEEVNNYSNIISNSQLLNEKWEAYAKEMAPFILNELLPVPGRYIKAVFRRMGFNNILFRKEYTIQLLNLIECESLNDLSQSILKQKKL
jgi:poly-gamma-glutamate synthesis protein (capsule biosynthesis protein)